MNYRSGNEKKGRLQRMGFFFGTSGVVVALFILFVFAVKWFRTPKEIIQTKPDTIVDVLVPTPVSDAIIAGAIDIVSREAVLYKTDSGEDFGLAKRGIKDDKYYLEIKSSLPEINRGIYFYEVWLLRQVPYTYFSVGEMITDEMGVFVLEWPASDEKDYSEFTNIIITLQEYGKSTDPQAHILEGEFGK